MVRRFGARRVIVTAKVALGPELVTNWNFTDWTGSSPNETPTGWSATIRDATNYLTENPADQCQVISNGAGVGLVRFTQANVITNGLPYRVVVVCSARTSGSCTIRDSTNTWNIEFSSIGTHTLDITGGSTDIQISAANCDITIDSISIKQIL
jgi:hypothetical protein